MAIRGSIERRASDVRRRSVLVVLLVLAFVAAGAAAADASVRVESHTIPAGDPTLIGYRITRPLPPPDNAPIDFQLHDNDFMSFGPFEGTVVLDALEPAGWEVADIKCIGPPADHFAIDVPHGRVTIDHRIHDETVCAFTNRRTAPGQPPVTGLSPSPITNSPGPVLPTKPLLMKVTVQRRGVAIATVRVIQRSVIRTQLLTKQGRIVGSSSTTRNPGTYDCWTSLTAAARRQLARGGLKHARLTLRVVVAPVSGRASVFRYPVLLRL